MNKQKKEKPGQLAWFWSKTHREWNLRKKHNSPSLATVFPNGWWHRWGYNGREGENSSCSTVEEAKMQALASVGSGEGPAQNGAGGRWVKRKSGSCRFSPYFKIEWFDAALCVWRPLQKTFATLALTDAAKDASHKWRVFEVSETGRRLMP